MFVATDQEGSAPAKTGIGAEARAGMLGKEYKKY